MADKVVIELTRDELGDVKIALMGLSSLHVNRDNIAEADRVWTLYEKLSKVSNAEYCVEELEKYKRNIARNAEMYIEVARRLDELVKQFQGGKEG